MEVNWRKRVLGLASAVLFVGACADEPVAPLDGEAGWGGGPDADTPALAVHLTCAVDVRADAMSCEPSAPSAAIGGPNMNLIVGNQHHLIRLANHEPTVVDDVWTAYVTVQNLTLQPMGTLDGSTPRADGVRVFFVDEPNNGVVVSNHDGTAMFIDSESAKYYAYVGADLGEDEILVPAEETEAKPWVFELNGATEFQFSVLVSTDVPDPKNIKASLVRIVAGGFHSCGEDRHGRVFCWGDNRFGQVGDGSPGSETRRYVPTQVAAPSGVTLSGVVAGHFHTCAEGSDGNVYCWGYNLTGQLGDGTTTNRRSPVKVSAPASVTLSRLSAGDYHTCANGSDGEVYCWGSNFYGALGDSTKIDSWTPVQVSAPDSVQLFDPDAGRYHTCARSVAGPVYCWGYNGTGEVGDSDSTAHVLPFKVSLPAGVVAFTHITAGVDHSCAESSDGRTFCWGGNHHGQLGDTTFVPSAVPVEVAAPSGVTLSGVRAGGSFTCADGSDGQVYCWGSQENGQLGDGSEVARATPAAVTPPTGVQLSSPSVGYAHVCAMGSKELYCWGNNTAGQVGYGNRTVRSLPTIVVGVTADPAT